LVFGVMVILLLGGLIWIIGVDGCVVFVNFLVGGVGIDYMVMVN